MRDALSSRRAAAEHLLEQSTVDPVGSRRRAVVLLAEATAEGDAASACFAEQAIAIASAATGDLDLMHTHSQRAVALATGLEDRDVLSHALATRCAYSVFIGDAAQLEADLSAGLQFATGLPRARLLSNSARFAYANGRLDTAVVTYREALDLLPHGGPQWLGTSNNLAVALQALGRFDEAASTLRESLDGSLALGMPGAAARSLMNLALLDLAQGRVVHGLAVFDTADQQLRDGSLDPTPARIDRCRILLQLGLVDDAAATAVSLLAEVRERRPEYADVIAALLRALLLAGQWDQALAVADSEAAQQLATEAGQHSELPILCALTAWLGTESVDTAPPSGTPVLIAQVVAAGLILQGSDARARLMLTAATSNDRSETDDLLNDVLNAALGGDAHRSSTLIRAASEHLSQADHAAAASIWAERIERIGFAVAVRSGLVDAAVDAVTCGRSLAAAAETGSTVVDDELDRLVAGRRSLWLEGAVSAPGVSRRPADGSLSARLFDQEQRIRARRMALAVPESLPVPLLSSTPTVAYLPADGRMVAVVVHAEQRRIVDLGPLEQVAQAVRRAESGAQRLVVSRAATDSRAADRWRFAVEALDALLVAPLELERPTRLTVVGGTELAGVTWGALPGLAGVAVRWAEEFGVEDPPRLQPDETVVLVGGPELNHVREELEAVGQFWPQARPLQGRDATGSEVTRSLGRSSLLHVGAHGVVRRDAPLFSHVSLFDGPLTLAEMVREPYLPQCIVLSACHLGPAAHPLGSSWPVAAALGRRGCRSLIVSSLPVHDASTVTFMAALHRGLRAGEPPPDALAAAHADALRRGDHGCIGFVEIAIRAR